MRITELGNRPYGYSTDKYRPGLFSRPTSWTFNSKDGRTITNIAVRKPGGREYIFDINFTVDNSQEITGGGDAFRILSSFEKILRDNFPAIIKKWPEVKKLRFLAAAGDTSRVKLYNRRFVPFFNQIMGQDWKYVGGQTITNNQGESFVDYTWTKDNKNI